MPDPNQPAPLEYQAAAAPPPQLTTAGGLNPDFRNVDLVVDPRLGLVPAQSIDAPLTTAGADQPQLFPSSTVDAHPVVAAVIGSVQATSEPHNWAMTAATVLQALSPLQDQVFAVSRASTKTQTQINLAEIGVVTLAGILQMFFPHPRAG